MFWPYNVYIRVQGPKDAMRNKLKYLTQLWSSGNIDHLSLHYKGRKLKYKNYVGKLTVSTDFFHLVEVYMQESKDHLYNKRTNSYQLSIGRLVPKLVVVTCL